MRADGEPALNPDVLEATQLALGGQHALARERIAALWHSLAEDDAFHRCVLAHYMADIQPDPHDELRWDTAALNAALAATPEAFEARIPGVTRASFLPSLHLNVAASYERIHQLELARQHATLARQAEVALGTAPLDELTRSAIARVCAALGVDA